MNQLNKRIFFILLSLTLFVLSIMVFTMFVKPTYAEISKMRGEYAAKKEAYLTYKTSIDQLKAAFQGYSNSTQIQENISRALPITKDPAYIMTQVVGFAKVNKIQISSIGVQAGEIRKAPNSAVKKLGIINVTVASTGGYGDFKNFLKQMEDNLLIFDVISLNAAPQKDKGVLQYQLQLQTYYQAE